MKNVIANLDRVNQVFQFRFLSDCTKNPGKGDL